MTTVNQTLTLSEKREQAYKAEVDALKLENSLLRDQLKNQPGFIAGAGGAGLLLGFLAGVFVPR